ncbi:Uncharacterized protein K02A2.6 [Araneus ventricosus]|uniref:Uncharacterized protein K02A2.6 n=1 Tax=Araneus ventricosus TaxID=182803 RepID=A0A4Y2FJ02_ARAVE|nr:Uncharacterized protein K02A2.6 [Araneus ventricosus]
MNEILAKFEAYFIPQRNITYERQKLLLLVQQEGQSVDDFRKQLINADYQPILGLSVSADKLGLGNLPGKYHITLGENSVPVVSVTGKLAFSLLEPLKAELDKMVKTGVIEKVTEPTDCVSPLVKKKNGALRVCLDRQNLNRAIKRSRYNLPTFEDITSTLAGAKYFIVLDAISAFWQISLDEESSRLCTFSSPFGRFKFLRTPYSINFAPGRLQKVVAEMLEDIQNADNFFDDLIVWGKTLEKHNETLEKVFKRCIEFNLKLIVGSIDSPAELLMNLKLSTVLPNLSILKGVQNESYYNYQKKQRDRRAMLKSDLRTLLELQPGSSVFVQNIVRQWKPAEILRQNEIPRSYRIRTYNGEVRTRNRIHLRPNKCSDLAPFKNPTGFEDHSTSDTIPESTPAVKSQEPVNKPASDFQSSQECSSHEPGSRSPDKGLYRIGYGRVVTPPSRYVVKF